MEVKVGELKKVLNSIDDNKEIKVFEMQKHRYYLLENFMREGSKTVVFCIYED